MSATRSALQHEVSLETHLEAGSTAGRARTYECDMCGDSFTGPPAGAGLFIWTRGDEVRYEEPPLCETCGSEIALSAALMWAREEEEEG
ncbi:MAG TPA: hypothetical protein VKZ49_02075 [Polyangiaceae bacterium]|nr:hypothetical protein [Polyangiaceae bacterium]